MTPASARDLFKTLHTIRLLQPFKGLGHEVLRDSCCQWAACYASIKGTLIAISSPQGHILRQRYDHHLRALFCVSDSCNYDWQSLFKYENDIIHMLLALLLRGHTRMNWETQSHANSAAAPQPSCQMSDRRADVGNLHFSLIFARRSTDLLSAHYNSVSSWLYVCLESQKEKDKEFAAASSGAVRFLVRLRSAQVSLSANLGCVCVCVSVCFCMCGCLSCGWIF